MHVLVVLLTFILPLECLGVSWPRQTEETIVETSIPEGLSNLGGLDPFFSLHPLTDVKTDCSMTENSVLSVSVWVRHTCHCKRSYSIGLSHHHISLEALQTYTRKPDCFRKAARAISTQCADLDMDEDARVNGINNKAVPLLFQNI